VGVKADNTVPEKGTKSSTDGGGIDGVAIVKKLAEQTAKKAAAKKAEAGAKNAEADKVAPNHLKRSEPPAGEAARGSEVQAPAAKIARVSEVGRLDISRIPCPASLLQFDPGRGEVSLVSECASNKRFSKHMVLHTWADGIIGQKSNVKPAAEGVGVIKFIVEPKTIVYGNKQQETMTLCKLVKDC
jgi:hypothetical protein